MFWGESRTSSCWSQLHGVTLLPQSKAEFCCLPVLFSSHHLMICWYFSLFWHNLNLFRWKFMAVQDTGPNSCMVRHVETTLIRGQITRWFRWADTWVLYRKLNYMSQAEKVDSGGKQGSTHTLTPLSLGYMLRTDVMNWTCAYILLDKIFHITLDTSFTIRCVKIHDYRNTTCQRPEQKMNSRYILPVIWCNL